MKQINENCGKSTFSANDISRHLAMKHSIMTRLDETRGISCLDGHSRSRNTGTPDLVCCVDGKFVVFFIIDDGDTATKVQRYAMDKIRKAGGHAAAISSFEDAAQAINEVRDFYWMDDDSFGWEENSDDEF